MEMRLYEATVLDQDGNEITSQVMAPTMDAAVEYLKQWHGENGVKSIPKVVATHS